MFENVSREFYCTSYNVRKFCSINSFVSSLVKTLVSWIFLWKNVRVNFCNFHTVLLDSQYVSSIQYIGLPSRLYCRINRRYFRRLAIIYWSSEKLKKSYSVSKIEFYFFVAVLKVQCLQLLLLNSSAIQNFCEIKFGKFRAVN